MRRAAPLTLLGHAAANRLISEMNSGDMGVNKTAFPAALEQSRCREQKGFVGKRDDAAIFMRRAYKKV
jgi:hypothetical protein